VNITFKLLDEFGSIMICTLYSWRHFKVFRESYQISRKVLIFKFTTLSCTLYDAKWKKKRRQEWRRKESNQKFTTIHLPTMILNSFSFLPHNKVVKVQECEENEEWRLWHTTEEGLNKWDFNGILKNVKGGSFLTKRGTTLWTERTLCPKSLR